MIKRNLIKQKKVSTSKIRISGPGYRLSDGKHVSNTDKSKNLSPKEIKTEEFRRTLSDHTTFYPSGKRNHLQPKRCTLVLRTRMTYRRSYFRLSKTVVVGNRSSKYEQYTKMPWQICRKFPRHKLVYMLQQLVSSLLPCEECRG